MSEELKSCPFCGCDEPMVMEHTSSDWVIHCKKCHAKTGRYHTFQGAIYSWNSRHESDELIKMVQTRIDELEEQIEENCTYRSRDLVNHEIVTLKWVLTLRKTEDK